MDALPQKLKSVPIAEALCEIQFESRESNDLPEVALGKLTQNPNWQGYNAVRLPISDIPAPIRKQDANLKHQASVELRQLDAPLVVKLGSNVASYHRLAPYPGWAVFKGELSDFVAFTFGALSEFVCTRVGFRYVNTFTYGKHGISGVDELSFDVQVGGKNLSGPVNLNYKLNISPDTEALVRVAAPAFVNANNVQDLTALIDIDVYTKSNVVFRSSEEVIEWIESAHTALKEQFFSLFTEKMMGSLIEE